MALDTLAGQPLADLFNQYAQSISILRTLLGEEDPFEDDHILLRLLIQEHEKIDAAAAKAKEGRAFRRTYGHVLKKAKMGEHLPQEDKIRQHLCYGRWSYPDAESEKAYPPMLITRSGRSNANALMQVCSVEELVAYFIWERQRCFNDVIRASQETGKMVMMVGINDLDNASLITGREPKFFEAVKISSETGACLFPLLTRKHVMVNSGRFIEILFRMVSAFMPQRVLDKVAFMTCEELLTAAAIPPKSFPNFLGGSCAVPPNSPLSRGADPGH
jgi:hypothetical protein